MMQLDKRKTFLLAKTFVVAIAFLLWLLVQPPFRVTPSAVSGPKQDHGSFDRQIVRNARRMIEEGRQIFRFDTFGDETFWGDALRLHEAIEGEKFGGVGPGLSPNMALSLGLKVDQDALPPEVVEAIKQGKVDLDDPATTLTLLRLNAVVGVTGFFKSESKALLAVGIQCALCHSTVDDSFSPGIGHRLDGWANRDLNVGAIVALAPDLSPFSNLLKVDEKTVRTVLNSWGPGKGSSAVLMLSDYTGPKPVESDPG